MRSAPSVVYPVGRCVFHGCLLIALGVLGLTVLVAWAWSASGRIFAEATWLGAGLWLLWSIWALLVWWRTPAGDLHWDSLALPDNESLRAGAWMWHADKTGEAVPLCSIECVLDGQSRILLRLKPPARLAIWVWAERDHAPAHWGDLRRALVAASDR